MKENNDYSRILNRKRIAIEQKNNNDSITSVIHKAISQANKFTRDYAIFIDSKRNPAQNHPINPTRGLVVTRNNSSLRFKISSQNDLNEPYKYSKQPFIRDSFANIYHQKSFDRLPNYYHNNLKKKYNNYYLKPQVRLAPCDSMTLTTTPKCILPPLMIEKRNT